MKLIDYKLYCSKVLLTEETLDELMSRVQEAFPDPEDFKAHKAILDKFPNFGGKQIIAGLLIRTRFERKKGNITPEATLGLLEEFKKIQMAMTGPGQKIDLALLAKQDKTEHPDDKDSQLFEKLTMTVHEKIAILRDRAQKKLQKKSVKVGGDEEEEEEILQFPNADNVYADKNVEIYLTLSPGIISQIVNDPGSICTQRPGNYYGYRFNDQATLYIVVPKIPELRTKYRFLQFDIRPNGTVIVVDQRNQQASGTMMAQSRNPEESLQRNLSKVLTRSNWWDGFPELKNAIEKGVFKIIPIQANEKQYLDKIQNVVNDDVFKSFDYITKTAYIGFGWNLTNKQWDMIDGEQKNAYINSCSNKDLTPYQFEQIKHNAQLLKRYLAIKKRAVIQKIESGTFTSNAFTSHESIVLGDIMKTADPKIKSAITKGLTETIKKILAGGHTPTIDISGMYNLVKSEFLNNESIKDEAFLLSVAKLLAGEKSFQWKNVSPEILRSIYKISKDIYDTNPQKMDAVINNLIKKDPNILLQGLLSEPTHFQIQYFEKNKEELLSRKDFNDKLIGSIESNLVYGTEMTPWLKSYWNNNKKSYLSDEEFVKKLKYDLTTSLYGKTSGGHGLKIENASEESKEIYNLFIKDIQSDTNQIMEIVQKVIQDSVITGGANIYDVNNWDVSSDFKKFFAKHEPEIKTWLTYKLIDVPPDNIRPDLVKLIEEYKNITLTNPTYQKKIEDRLIHDIVDDENTDFRWSGTRIDYWIENFWAIINKNPGLEEKILKRVIYEYGKNNAANPLYVEYCIPFEFYKKHKDKIVSNADAFRGLKNRIIDVLRWRNPKELTTAQVLKSSESSNVERDFYSTYGKTLENDKNSKWFGKPIFDEERVSPNNAGQDY
jgi:hypothetical protein